jgi:hypothetical protein
MARIVVVEKMSTKEIARDPDLACDEANVARYLQDDPQIFYGAMPVNHATGLHVRANRVAQATHWIDNPPDRSRVRFRARRYLELMGLMAFTNRNSALTQTLHTLTSITTVEKGSLCGVVSATVTSPLW